MKEAKQKTTFQTANEVVNALKAKYEANAYAFLEQVGDGTGARLHRWCDALVMSLWPSRGLDIIGIEIKVRRSDWLKELSLPQKADAIARYCDYWYVAVGDENIVQNGELPSTWGLMVPRADGKLYCKKEATKLEPLPLSREFLAAVLRQATGQLTDTAKMALEYHRGRQEGRDEEKRIYENGREYVQGELKDLREKVARFEKASGVNIQHAWNAGDLGHAVRRVLNGEDGNIRKQLVRLHEQAIGIARSIQSELEKDQPTAEETTP
jgi:hypothetical protein